MVSVLSCDSIAAYKYAYDQIALDYDHLAQIGECGLSAVTTWVRLQVFEISYAVF